LQGTCGFSALQENCLYRIVLSASLRDCQYQQLDKQVRLFLHVLPSVYEA